MDINLEKFKEIMLEASDRFYEEINKAYNEKRLGGFLQTFGMEDLIPQKDSEYFDTYPEGKILIIGSSPIKDKDILGCCKSLGLEKDRVELITDYTKINKYNFSKLEYNPNIRLILFGAIPHSTEGKGKYSSIINRIEDLPKAFAKSIRMGSNGLKFTKSNLKETLETEINSGYLIV